MSVGGSLTYYNALRARTWLMLGGQLGLHRLYLDEPLEAFVYFATGGIFLFGIFYDIFAIHSIVERQNARIKRSSSRATREMISSEKFASSSIKRFIAQFLFGYWMGLIYGLTMLFTFSIQRRPVLLSIIIAIGVAKGVFVVGNSRHQRRSLLLIWIASFCTCFLFIVIFKMSIFRTLLLAALFATLFGNRGARSVSVNSRRFTRKTYLVLCAVYCLVLLLFISGISKCVLNQRIVVVSAKHQSRISSSIAGIVYDRYFSNTNKSIFSSGSQIQYIPFKPNSPYRQSTTANSFIFNKHASMDDKRRVSDKRWWSILLMDMVTSESENINLVDYVIVFVSDYLRAEALSRTTEQKLRTDNAHRFDALEWTAWRQLAIYMTESSPYVCDVDLLQKCDQHLQQIVHKNRKAAHSEQVHPTEWQYLAIKKACSIVRSINDL